jgi:thioredoxin
MEAITIKVDDATFGDVVGSAKPVLVDFTAAWCAPCRVIEPVLEAIADEYRDQLTVAKLDVDESPQTALRYSVMSMPTLILFQDGAEKKRLVGARSKHVLVHELSEVLA